MYIVLLNIESNKQKVEMSIQDAMRTGNILEEQQTAFVEEEGVGMMGKVWIVSSSKYILNIKFSVKFVARPARGYLKDKNRKKIKEKKYK